MVRSRSIGLISRVLGFAFISDISNISRVLIPNIIGDNLGTTIGKIYTVFTRGSITITVLTLSKVGTRVVISDSITVLVESWAFISGLMVSLLRVSGLVGRSGLVGGSRLVDWGRLVDRGGVVRSGLVDWSRLVDRGRVVRSGLVDWGRIVDGRVGGVGLRMSMVNGVTVDGVGESMVAMNVGMVTVNVSMVTMEVGMIIMNVGMVTMEVGMVTIEVGMVTIEVGMVTVEVGMVTMKVGLVTMKVVDMITMKVSMVTMNVGMVTMNGSMVSMVKVKSTVVARGVDTSNIFLLIVVLVNLIGSGSGLGVHSSMIFTMGSTDGGRDSRGVALLEALVAVLVGGSQGQEGRENDKSLHVLMMVIDRTKSQ